MRETKNRPRPRREGRQVSSRQAADPELRKAREFFQSLSKKLREFDNDPSAGSPTETLLRLLLPLNAQVWESFRATMKDESFKGPVQVPH